MLQNKENEQRIRDTVEDILSRREFQETTNGENTLFERIRQLWEDFLEWIRQLLERKQPREDLQFNPTLQITTLQTVSKIILIVLAAVLLYFLIRMVVKRIYLNKRIRRAKAPQAADYLKDPDAVTARIKSLMEQKDFTAALCFLFVAVLLELHAGKIIRIEKWKTNRGYIREIVLNCPDLVPPMREFSSLFNECCYGNRTVEETRINLWLDFFLKLKERKV